MIYSDMVKWALNLAFEAHKEQTDKAGYPYIFHPYHLAEQFFDEDSVVVALLHDVVEDTDWTIERLREEGFHENVLAALELLTHKKDVPYMEYVRAINENPLARRVKIADLRHNCDVTRGGDSEKLRKKREECYYPALALLTATEEEQKGMRG